MNGRTVVGALGLLGALLGCAAADGVVGGECVFGLSSCDHRCVDLSTEREHCGACGQACASDQECLAGSCLRRRAKSSQEPEPSPEPDPPMMTKPSEPDERAQGGTGGRGGSPVSAGTAGEMNGSGGAPTRRCTSPTNTADRCGDCETMCSANAPLCAPAKDSFECVNRCPDELLLCGQRCVDAERDPLHCGVCESPCSSGLCRNGSCEEAAAGHVVMMCMSFEEVYQRSPQVTLLGNAVFLPASNLVRILVYEGDASNGVRFNARRALGWASKDAARSFELVVASGPESVANHLTTSSYDVFWMLDARDTDGGPLGRFGKTLSTTLASFTQGGGTVILIHSAATPGTAEFLNDDGAGLLDVTGLGNATSSELRNHDPKDPVGLRVPTLFTALVSTCTYETQIMPGGDLSVVVSGVSEEEDAEAPVVVHRVVPPQGR